jgi:hypothetical protein
VKITVLGEVYNVSEPVGRKFSRLMGDGVDELVAAREALSDPTDRARPAEAAQVSDPTPDPTVTMLAEALREAIKALGERPPVVPPAAPLNLLVGDKDTVKALEMQKPSVTVEAPIVNVAASDLSGVEAAVESIKDAINSIKAPDVLVNVDNVRVTSLPDRAHRIVRDLNGKPTGSVETDA